VIENEKSAFLARLWRVPRPHLNWRSGSKLDSSRVGARLSIGTFHSAGLLVLRYLAGWFEYTI
jgi:hypothetical protein